MKKEIQLTEMAGWLLFISHSSITDMVENSTLGEIPWGNEMKNEKEEKTERKSETLKIMRRQSAEEDNDTLGRSIYPNNLCPEANGTGFYDASEISQHSEWKRYTPGTRQISSWELLSVNLEFGKLDLGLDKGSLWCSPQMWPEFHLLYHQSRERYSSHLSRRSAFMKAFTEARAAKTYLCVSLFMLRVFFF